MSLLSSLKSGVSAEVEKLKAEEAAKKRADALAMLPSGFADTIAAIEAHGMGFPALERGAARAFSVVKGWPIVDAHGGSGDLKEVKLYEVGQFAELLVELDGLKKETAPVAEVLPPDAPAPDKATAFVPVEGYSLGVQAEMTVPVTMPDVPTPVADRVIEQVKAVWNEQMSQIADAATEPAEKPRRGRPRKTETAASPTVTIHLTIPQNLADALASVLGAYARIQGAS